MGAEKNSVKISYNGIDYVQFKDDIFSADVQDNKDKMITVLARFNLNVWAGKVSVQCFIEDYEFVSNKSKFDF